MHRISNKFCVLALLITTAGAVAHHSVPVNFDQSREILVKGTLVEVSWLNPHTHWLLEVERDDGETENWLVEHGSVNAMRRSDFAQYLHLFTVGTEVAVVGAPGYRDRTVYFNRTEVLNGSELLCVDVRGQLNRPCVPDPSGDNAMR